MIEYGTTITRRDFLKLSAVTGISFIGNNWIHVLNEYAKEVMERSSPEIDPATDRMVAATMTNSAVDNAIQLFDGVAYNWDEGAHCSSFISRIVAQFGYPFGALDSTDPKRFPGSGTTLQREWLRQLDRSLFTLSGQSFGSDVPIEQILQPDFWANKRPGSLVYLATAVSHNGYNTLSHVATFIGMENNRPLFAEFKPKMLKGPQTQRTLNELSSMYTRNSSGNFDLRPYDTGSKDPDRLIGYVWDTIGAAREMWREGGPIMPEGRLVTELDTCAVITVNTNDGTIGYWRVSQGQAVLIPIHSADSPYAFAAIGRRLRKNSPISTFNYYNAGMGKGGSHYDAINGVWYSERGCPRRTLTPPLTILVKDIAWIGNFGGIGGRTHILLGRPIEINDGQIITSQIEGNSDYTLHEVPRDTGNQEILLREPLIRKANIEGQPLQIPYLSSGCVNLDATTWQKIVTLTQNDLPDKPVFLVFSVPGFPLDLVMQKDFSLNNDPLGGKSSLWEYKGTEYSEQTPIVRPPQDTTTPNPDSMCKARLKGCGMR